MKQKELQVKRCIGLVTSLIKQTEMVEPKMILKSHSMFVA